MDRTNTNSYSTVQIRTELKYVVANCCLYNIPFHNSLLTKLAGFDGQLVKLTAKTFQQTQAFFYLTFHCFYARLSLYELRTCYEFANNDVICLTINMYSPINTFSHFHISYSLSTLIPPKLTNGCFIC